MTDAERAGSGASAASSRELVTRSKGCYIDRMLRVLGLSQAGVERTHPGRDIDQEEPCTSVALTTEANGSEDTPATPTTASAGRLSTATEAGGTSTTRTAPAAKGTAGSQAPSTASGSGSSAAIRYESAEHAPNPILRERIEVAMTLAHNHPGVAGVRDGAGCPRCNAEHALRELLRRAV